MIKVLYSNNRLRVIQVSPKRITVNALQLEVHPWDQGQEVAQELMRDRRDYRKGVTLKQLGERRGVSWFTMGKLMRAMGERRRQGGRQPSHAKTRDTVSLQ